MKLESLDPELQELCREWKPSHRRDVAKKLAKWVYQLMALDEPKRKRPGEQGRIFFAE